MILRKYVFLYLNKKLRLIGIELLARGMRKEKRKARREGTEKGYQIILFRKIIENMSAFELQFAFLSVGSLWVWVIHCS